MLCSPVPQNPSHATSLQRLRIAGHWSRTWGHAKGSISASAPTQRMKVNASGDTWPVIARPITQLTDQKRIVRVSRRYGDAWNAGALRGIEDGLRAGAAII